MKCALPHLRRKDRAPFKCTHRVLFYFSPTDSWRLVDDPMVGELMLLGCGCAPCLREHEAKACAVNWHFDGDAWTFGGKPFDARRLRVLPAAASLVKELSGVNRA